MQLLSIIILLTLTVVIHSLWMFGVLKFIKLEVDSAVRIVLRNVGIVISMIFAHLLRPDCLRRFILSSTRLMTGTPASIFHWSATLPWDTATSRYPSTGGSSAVWKGWWAR